MDSDKSLSGKDKLKSFLDKHKKPEINRLNQDGYDEPDKADNLKIETDEEVRVSNGTDGEGKNQRDNLIREHKSNSEAVEKNDEPPAMRAEKLIIKRCAEMRNSPYRALYCLGVIKGHFTGEGEAVPEVFERRKQGLNKEKQQFLKSLESKAFDLLKQTPECCDENYSVDAQMYIKVSEDGMRAWTFALPAIGNGAQLNAEAVKQQVEKAKITFGLDIDPVINAVEANNYMQIITIARGEKGAAGIDGAVSERFQREKKISFTVGGNSTVDYKNLNWVQKVSKGDIICDLVQPTLAVSGMSVTGMTVKKRDGEMPIIPGGTNTEINSEKTALVSTCDGQINYSKGIFNVERMLRIRGDVDNSVGNLDINGDLEIDGNVVDGYTVKATGDILIKGLAEGAALEAGGDITVKVGMKGNSKGTAIAKGAIYCKYIENATVRAGKGVTADYIVNSSVSAKDNITVLKGHGAIIGGKIYAVNKIEAKSIGNESNRNTELLIGADADTREGHARACAELERKNRAIHENELNIGYIEKSQKIGAEHKELLSRIKLQLTVDKLSVSKLQKQIKTFEELMTSEEGQVVADIIYPQVSVEVNGTRTVIHSTERLCRIRKQNGEIVVGMK